MKSKKVLILIGAIFIIVIAIWAWDRFQDQQVKIRIESETALYASEEDAAYRHHPPIKTIKATEKVKVKRTTYGKDYWVLFIETSDASRGWVDSGQPGIVIIRKN